MFKITDKVVFLDRGNYTTCTVHLHGGTILSYRVKNREMLFMAKSTPFNIFSPIRGGIKMTFPYFGTRVNGPRHGFSRYVPWKLEEGPKTLEDGNVTAVFSLEDSEYTKAIWNFKFKLSYRLTLCMNELRIAVKVENTSKYFPFRFTIMRHSMFRVMDVTKCEISGLTDSKCIQLKHDEINDINELIEDEKIVVNRSYMDLFLNEKVPVVVEISNFNEKTGIKMKITSTDELSGDVLIYNPWIYHGPYIEEKCFSSDYLHILGVSNGHIRSEIRLVPKETWEANYIIEVIDEEYDKKIEELGRLLDNPMLLFQDVCKKTDLYSSK